MAQPAQAKTVLSYNVTRFSTYFDDRECQIDNGRIVWRRNELANPAIFLYRISDGLLTTLSTNVEDGHPTIKGSRVAWVRGFGDSSEIMLHDLATGKTTQLTSNTYLDDYPFMGANELVWNTGNDSPPYTRGVHLLDFTTGADADITAFVPTPHPMSPKIDNHPAPAHTYPTSGSRGWILWNAPLVGSYQMTIYDIARFGTPGYADIKLQLPQDPKGSTPNVEGGRIVWQASDGQDLEIFMYTISTGKTVQLTANNRPDMLPDIDGRWVVWQSTNGYIDDIWVRDLVNGMTTKLVTMDDVTNVQVDDDVVIWEGKPSNEFRGLFYAGLEYVTWDPFPDVGKNQYCWQAVEVLSSEGIVDGYADGTFRPEDLVLRAQFAKMIAGVLGLDVHEGLEAPFRDLGEDDPASLYPHDFVAAAYLAGITKGTIRTAFSPWQNISRAQLVTMVVRAMQQPLYGGLLNPVPGGHYGTLGNFSDIHATNMAVAEANGLLNGVEGFGLRWDPWAEATRAETAQILWNAYRLLPSAK